MAITTILKDILYKYIKPEDVILDIGCHVGLLAQTFPNNEYVGFDILIPENVFKSPLVKYNECAVISEDSTFIGRILDNNNPMENRVCKFSENHVKAESFNKVLLENPDTTVIKIDIEGAEQGFDFTNLPSNIRLVIIEWHDKEKVIPGFNKVYTRLPYPGYAKLRVDEIWEKDE